MRIVGMAFAADTQWMRGTAETSSSSQYAISSCLWLVASAKLIAQMAGSIATAAVRHTSPAEQQGLVSQKLQDHGSTATTAVRNSSPTDQQCLVP